MSAELIYLSTIFFTIALFYSIAGFGGGSSYLAILALFSFDQDIIRSTALICNIAVVSTASFLYYKNGFLKFKKIIPIIFLSIPFAFLGGRIVLQQEIFFLILGITLLIAAIAMLLNRTQKTLLEDSNNTSNVFIGGIIGFLSGLVGIGGGIFLSPVLHLSKWNNAKVIAATCSFFILVNSIAGLIGLCSQTRFSIQWELVIFLFASVFLGGQIGSRLSTNKLNTSTIRKTAAVLILIVAVRILYRSVFL